MREDGAGWNLQAQKELCYRPSRKLCTRGGFGWGSFPVNKMTNARDTQMPIASGLLSVFLPSASFS